MQRDAKHCKLIAFVTNRRIIARTGAVGTFFQLGKTKYKYSMVRVFTYRTYTVELRLNHEC